MVFGRVRAVDLIEDVQLHDIKGGSRMVVDNDSYDEDEEEEEDRSEKRRRRRKDPEAAGDKTEPRVCSLPQTLLEIGNVTQVVI